MEQLISLIQQNIFVSLLCLVVMPMEQETCRQGILLEQIFPQVCWTPRDFFLSNLIKKVWIHNYELKFLLCWTCIQPHYLCLWSRLSMMVNSDLSKKRQLCNCLCKENLICFKHKVWWKRKLIATEGKIYSVLIWSLLSFGKWNTRRLFVCLFVLLWECSS